MVSPEKTVGPRKQLDRRFFLSLLMALSANYIPVSTH